MQQLTGIKADSEKELEVVYPADHFDKRFADSTIKFKVKVKAVKQLNLIELNEEFFKQFDTNAKTLDEFKDKLRSDIQAKKTKEANDALRDDLIKEVIDKNQFDLPESLIERYLDNVVEDFKKNYKEKFEEKEVRDHYKTIGIRQIRWDFLMNEIAAKENIKVEQQDIDSWLQRFADNYKMTLEEAREQVTKSRRIADLKETILENKVIEFITNGSTIETVEAPMTYSE
jgi:trigger factor